MTYFMFILFWLIGLGISSFTVIPILIMFRFGIPVTRKLERNKLLSNSNGIIKGYFISMLILTGVFIIVILLIKTFIPGGFSGFIVGTVLSLFFGIGQTGKNKNNISDYMETNARHFKISGNEIIQTILVT